MPERQPRDVWAVSDRDPGHLYGPFRIKFELILQELDAYLSKHHPGMTCKLVQGYRSAQYQHSLWLQGRNGNPGPVVTQRDGYKVESNHQSSLAADVGIFKGPAYIEEPAEDINQYYGHLVRAQGLTWGGDWTSIVDKPHAEWVESDKATYAAARVWQKANGLRA